MSAKSVSILRLSQHRDVSERHSSLREAGSERVGRLPHEAKASLAIDMTDAMVHVCVQGMKAQNPDMPEEELTRKLRERFRWVKRRQERGGPVE